MNHAYGLFSKLPDRFSNGVVDPRSEFRLLERDSLSPLPSIAFQKVESGRFTGVPDANPGILNLQPTLRLAPGKRYELEFTWENHAYQGVLQFVGRDLFREYALPASGERLAFGTTQPHSSKVTLWTTATGGDEVTVRFIPTGPGSKAGDFSAFSRFSFPGDRSFCQSTRRDLASAAEGEHQGADRNVAGNSAHGFAGLRRNG
jgi:hypothetical protein